MVALAEKIDTLVGFFAIDETSFALIEGTSARERHPSWQIPHFSFQVLILVLWRYWGAKGSAFLQPYSMCIDAPEKAKAFDQAIGGPVDIFFYQVTANVDDG